MEYATALTRQSSTPMRSPLPDSSSGDVANAISATPPNARARPIPRWIVNRSLRNIAASRAISTGETWISIAAVPASTFSSPALRATL